MFPAEIILVLILRDRVVINSKTTSVFILRDKRASIELAVQRLYKKLSGSASSIFEETLTAALQLEHDKYAEEREAAVSEERSRCEKECGVKLKAERNLHRHEIMKLRERSVRG